MDLNEDIEEFYDCAEICGCGDYDHNYVSSFWIFIKYVQ